MVDLESGATANPDVEVEASGGLSAAKMDKKKLGRLRSGSLGFTGSVTSDDGFYSSEDEEKLKVLVREEASSARVVKENRKKTGANKKPSKPPRPPMGPSLDAADVRLAKEMAEVARLKKARIQRMRALNCKRTEKASSSTSSICAMVVTILFFCIIIFQGILGSRV